MHRIWPVLLLVVAAPLVGRIVWRRRRQAHELTRLARRRGLAFAPLDLIGLHERYYDLACIRQGHNRRAFDVLYGSTDAGLVAVFRYRFDLGFGVEQVSKQWWVAVLESPRPLAAWQAWPADEPRLERPEHSARIGPLAVAADRPSTLDALRQPPLASFLTSVPEDWHFEARTTLAAVVAPFDHDFTVPDRLLASLAEWARLLPGDET